MSSAHRPTWTPAQGKGDTRHVSKIASVRDLPSQTSLKYRQQARSERLPGDAAPAEDSRAALKAELERSEREARNKKRKAEGLEPEPEPEDEEERETLRIEGGEDHEAGSPRRAQEVANGKRRMIDAEDAGDSDGEDDEDEDEDAAEIEARARAILKEQGQLDSDDSDASSDDDDDDDDDDETAQLMKELEKIKAERAAAAAKKAREEEEERERREEEIARGNPLLNDGLGSAGKDRERESTVADLEFGSSIAPSFGVKRRWDDDVIFKNQSAGASKPKGDFVNDLTRTEFHKEFMHRYIK